MSLTDLDDCPFNSKDDDDNVDIGEDTAPYLEAGGEVQRSDVSDRVGSRLVSYLQLRLFYSTAGALADGARLCRMKGLCGAAAVAAIPMLGEDASAPMAVLLWFRRSRTM